MKKLLALSLVLVMVTAIFVSCKNNSDNPVGGTTTVTDASGKPVVNPDDGFTAITGTVYVISENGLNVRSSPSAETNANNILGSLKYAAAVTRTGINETTGWSRILFNGEIAYVNSSYISTTQPAAITTVAQTGTEVEASKFTAVNKATVVYPTEFKDNKDVHNADLEVNYYSKAIVEKDARAPYIVGALKDGAAITVTGVYYEKADDTTYGWCKIKIGDGTTEYYIRNSQVKFIFDDIAAGTTAATTTAATAS